MPRSLVVTLAVSFVLGVAVAQNTTIFRISADDAALLSRKYAAYQQAQREWESASETVAERHGAKACGLDFSTDFTAAVPRPCSTTYSNECGGLVWNGQTIVQTPCLSLSPGRMFALPNNRSR